MLSSPRIVVISLKLLFVNIAPQSPLPETYFPNGLSQDIIVNKDTQLFTTLYNYLLICTLIIKQKNVIKVLGVYEDEHLIWKHSISYVCKKSLSQLVYYTDPAFICQLKPNFKK